MSGFFAKKYGTDKVDRISNKETLIVRDELFNLIKDVLIDTNISDLYGNKNLLISNLLTDKKDNGDIDSFIYLTPNFPDKIILDLINKNNQLLDVNKNDNVYSIYFKSNKVNKNIQVDIHITKDKELFEISYFNYYRVPYLFFLLGIFFHKIGLKLGINGIDLRIDVPNGDGINQQFVNIDLDIYTFLKDIFKFNPKKFYNLETFKSIADVFNESDIIKYDFLTTLKSEYLQKLGTNTTLHGILSHMKLGSGDIESYKLEIMKKIYGKYPQIEDRKVQALNKLQQIKQDNEIQRQGLCSLFNVSKLDDLTIDQKKRLKFFKIGIKELLIVKELSDKIYNKTGKPLYLVGGSVRNLLLEIEPKDLDITGEFEPEVIRKMFGGNITDKMGTVFFKYKGFDIEYTPFRREGNYTDGRRPDVVEFSKDITEDAKRRDFTINALYLDLVTLEIRDFYEGLKDIQFKKIKCVENAEERFKEDYLRILRAIRFKTRLSGFDIEEKTLTSIRNNKHNIEVLSGNRIVAELLMGVKYKGYCKTLIELDLMNHIHPIFKDISTNILLERADIIDKIIESGSEYSKNEYFLLGELLGGLKGDWIEINNRISSFLHSIIKESDLVYIKRLILENRSNAILNKEFLISPLTKQVKELESYFFKLYEDKTLKINSQQEKLSFLIDVINFRYFEIELNNSAEALIWKQNLIERIDKIIKNNFNFIEFKDTNLKAEDLMKLNVPNFLLGKTLNTIYKDVFTKTKLNDKKTLLAYVKKEFKIEDKDEVFNLTVLNDLMMEVNNLSRYKLKGKEKLKTFGKVDLIAISENSLTLIDKDPNLSKLKKENISDNSKFILKTPTIIYGFETRDTLKEFLLDKLTI